MNTARRIIGLIFAALVAVVISLAPTSAQATPVPALAAHEQVNNNSASSDYRVVVNQDATNYYLSPGHQVTIYTGTDRSVVVIGQSFRVRYDATSGPYMACQDLPNDGSGKRFTPAAGPDRIDYLLYNGKNCTHV